MAALGKAVRSAVSSGRHEITKGMRKTRSIGQDIEWWWTVNEVQIPGTKNALYRAFLDSLGQAFDTCPECKVFAFDLLRLLFPHRVRAWIKMATIGPPAICIKVYDAKRR
jgi:hypothetical protein